MGHDLVCLPPLPDGCEWAWSPDEFLAYPYDINVRDQTLLLIGWIEVDKKRAVGRPQENTGFISVQAESAQQAADYLSAQFFLGEWMTKRK